MSEGVAVSSCFFLTVNGETTEVFSTVTSAGTSFIKILMI